MKNIKFLFVFIFSFLAFNNIVLANPYPKTYKGALGNDIINCTWYAWQAAKDRMGVELPTWYYVETWYTKAKNSGFSVGQTPKENSIVVLNYNKAFNATGLGGHVAYVTKVEGNNITYDEGGNSFTGGGISTGNVWSLDELKMMGLEGFIYLDVPRTTTTKKTTTKTTKSTTTTTTTSKTIETTTTTELTTETTTESETTTILITELTHYSTTTTAKIKNSKIEKKNNIKEYLLIGIIALSLILLIYVVSILIKSRKNL